MISKDQILHCFNKNAHTYNDHAEVQSRVAEKLAEHLPLAANNILEIGCGTGIFSQKLLERFPESSLLLTDIAPSMVQATRKRFEQFANVRVECQDGEQFPTSSLFDFISSSMTFHWFTDIKKSFNDIVNKLVPGGHFTFSMLGANSLQECREIFANHINKIPTPFFPCADILKKTFPKITMKTEVLQHTYPSLFSFLMTLKKIGAVATRHHYLPISAGQLRRLMREFSGPVQISYEVIYGHYIKP